MIIKKKRKQFKIKEIGICKIIIHQILLGWWCFVSLWQNKKGLNEIAMKFELVSQYMA